MEPLIRTIAADKVAGIAGRHEADFMVELGEPIPAEVMAVTLGLDRQRGREISLMNKKSQTSAVRQDTATSTAVTADVQAS